MMNLRSIIQKVLCLLALFAVLTLCSSCSGYGITELVKTTEFDYINIDQLKSDFDADDINLLQSDNGKIVLKEYMNKDKREYYAKSKIKNNELEITEGSRPLSTAFDSYIEIYLPKDYKGGINLHSTSGEVRCVNNNSEFRSLHIDTTSGIINAQNINALRSKLSSTSGEIKMTDSKSSVIEIENTSGNSTLDNVQGEIKFQGKSGNIVGINLIGGGSFNMSADGKIKLDFRAVNNNISAYTKNESLSVTLPRSLNFSFSAETKDGAVRTNFDDVLNTEGNKKTGIIGSSPDINIRLESKNGDVIVR